MYFSTLPNYIQIQIAKLPKDKEFQDRFATDKQLDEIEEMKTNMADQFKCLQLVLNNKLQINGKPYNCLTPSIWSYLWVIDSPFVNYEKEVKETDIDLFFYILHNGLGNGDPVSLFSKSIQFTKKIGIDYQQALSTILSLIKISFKPLNLFPKSVQGGGRNAFDADWLTSLAAKVHQVTGYKPYYIITEMSLAQACYYFAQYRRMNGSDQIYKRTPEQILQLEDHRAAEMVIERLIEKEVIPPEQKQKWLNEITTKP